MIIQQKLDLNGDYPVSFKYPSALQNFEHFIASKMDAHRGVNQMVAGNLIDESLESTSHFTNETPFELTLQKVQDSP